MNEEKTVYETLYARQLLGEYARGYGHSNHGEGHLAEILADNPASVLDAGCGHNEFAQALRARGIKAWGVDFACPSADEIVDLLSMPYRNNEWDYLTAWDVLEHLRPEQVHKALAEMARVSMRFGFTIAHSDSYHRLDGRTLHPTVENEEWWRDAIMKHAESVTRTDSGVWKGVWR